MTSPTHSQESGTVFPLGMTTVTIGATDAASHTTTGTFTVTVRDTTGPVLTVPANLVAEATSAAGAAVSFAVSASDAVDGPVNALPDHASGSTFPLGTTTVLVTASDTLNNSASASFTVTVRDTIAPVVAAHANVTAEAMGAAGAVVDYLAGSATDAVTASPAITYSQGSGTIFPVGVTTVTITATDAAGNTGAGAFTVTVQDTIAPAVAAHANVTAEAMGALGALVNYGAGAATDAVTASPALAYSQDSGTVFPLGMTTVTITATDAAGNTGSGTCTVTVQDTTAPVITVPANIVAEATSAVGAEVSFAVSASDAVDGPANAVPDHASGSLFPLGTTTVVVTASDTGNHSATASFTVTVRDTTAPVVAAHANVIAEAMGALGALVNYAAGTTTDAVTANPALAYSQDSGTVFPLGVTTVTITATDAAGNTSTGTFTVTVQDTTGPVITVPANIVAEATSAVGAAVSFAVSASDAVDGPANAVPDHASGSTFPLGTTTVLVTASDTGNNNSSASFTVTVLDTTAPVVTPPANRTVPATSPSGAVVSYPAATVTDAVGVASLTYSQNSGAIFPIGTTTVTATAMDAANNTGAATFTVTVTPLSALQSWRFAHFGTVANAGDAADAADPYKTGIPNLLLFAFLDPNQDPSQATSSQLPQVQMADGNLFFSFTEPAGISGITYGAESGTTLQLEDWQAIPDTGHDALHLFSVPIGNQPQLFIRLRVTSP